MKRKGTKKFFNKSTKTSPMSSGYVDCVIKIFDFDEVPDAACSRLAGDVIISVCVLLILLSALRLRNENRRRAALIRGAPTETPIHPPERLLMPEQHPPEQHSPEQHPPEQHPPEQHPPEQHPPPHVFNEPHPPEQLLPLEITPNPLPPLTSAEELAPAESHSPEYSPKEPEYSSHPQGASPDYSPASPQYSPLSPYSPEPPPIEYFSKKRRSSGVDVRNIIESRLRTRAKRSTADCAEADSPGKKRNRKK